MPAIETDPLVLPIIAKTDQMVRAVRAGRAQFLSETEQMKRASAVMRRQLEGDSGAIGASFKNLAGVIATYISTQQISGLVDGFTRFQNSLRVAGLEGEGLAAVQDRLRKIGAEYGVELEALGQVFSRASMAQKDLGASTEDMIRLNEIIAAGLKITGTSSQEASGALLQLGQALGAGTVRAEEFNSLLEGALPVAQAAARGIDGMGGSVSRLRTAIAEGEVSSKQFFEGVLAGGAQTLADADRATMTLAGAVTALRNELTLFVGEGAKSNGLVAAMTQGILGLAGNLDKLATALTVIATVAGSRWVAAMVAARGATMAHMAAIVRDEIYTKAFTAALAENAGMMNAQAVAAQRAAAATTGLGVAAGVAGRSILALFGGPLGLALTAFTIGIVAAANETEGLSKSVKDLEQEIDAARAQADGFEAAARKAGATIKSVGDESAKAAGGVDQLSASFREAARRAEELAQKSGLAALRMAQLKIMEAQTERQSVLDNSAQRRTINNTGLFGRFLPNSAIKPTMLTDDEQAKLAAIDQKEAAYRRQVAALTANPKFGTANFQPETGGSSPPVGKGKPKKSGGGRSGPSAEEIEARFLDELGRSTTGFLAARAQLTGAAQARYAAEIAALNEEMSAYERQIAADKNLSATQKARLVTARKAELGERAVVAEQELSRSERETAFELFKAENDAKRETLSLAMDSIDNAADRRTAELRMLELQRELEEAQLDLILATKDSASAEYVNADARKKQLPKIYSDRAGNVRRDTEGPVESYMRELGRSSGAIAEDVERVAVSGLEKLNGELVDAIMNSKSLGDAFKNVANSIVSDLLRIAVQQAVIKPLASALFGGGGPGGGAILGPMTPMPKLSSSAVGTPRIFGAAA